MMRPRWPYPRALAHRGGGTLAPENTLAGLRTGLAHGYRGVEFDVMLAADEVPVLMHDPVLGRTVPGAGPVAACTAAALHAMDAGGWHPSGRYAGEPVPSYEEAVAFCRAHGLWMNVEIKPAPGAERRTGEVVGRLTRRLFADRLEGADPRALPLFSSFSPAALAAAREAAPEIPRGMLFDVMPVNWRDVLDALGCVSLHVSHRMLSAYLVEQVHAAGFAVLCYTPNDPARVAEIEAWGVDAWCTDRLDLMPRRSSA